VKLTQAIRESDYYGGDVAVLSNTRENDIYIVWSAWGGHGSASIVITYGEAAKLVTALEAALAARESLSDTAWGRATAGKAS
jgi:hypothetical protein